MSITVLNTDAGLSGKTLDTLETDQTITGAKTFDRDPNPPFVVTAGSAVVPNLDADKVDGIEGTAFAVKAGGNVFTGQQQVASGTVGAPGLSVGDTDVGLYSSGTNALDLTTNGVKALGIDSTQFVDSPTQPRCIASHGAVQSINSATYTAAIFSAADTLDIGSLHDTVTNNSRFTIPTGADGFYLITGTVYFDTNTTGVRQAVWRKNGTTYLHNYSAVRPPASVGCGVPATCMAQLAATDYVELMAYQDSGGALNIGDNATRELQNTAAIVKLW